MTEEIKSRIEAVRRGQVPEGYKLCESVPIPEGWDAKPLSKLSKVLTEPARDREYETLSISAGIGFVNQAEKFGKELSGKQYEKYTVLHEGDFAYNKGNSKKYPQGCTYQLIGRETAAVPNVFECFRTVGVEPPYYAQLFINGFMNHQLARKINHGVRDDGLLNLTEDDFFSTVLPVPPLPEQQKIAEILATCDKVIELKQKLIEENRRKKKWLMQKLLNPDSGVRLPGFEGSKWTSYQIKDVAEVINGGTPDTSLEDYWNGEVLWCTPSDISAAKKYISSTSQKITDKGLSNSSATLLPVGAILMCSRATIGPRAISTLPITTNQGFKSFICKEQVNNEFFYYYLDMVVPNFLKLSAGNTFKEVSKVDVEKEIIHIPTLPEQTAIASVLSCSDKQVEIYEQELAEWQQKKKALMQLLLTGLVRVRI